MKKNILLSVITLLSFIIVLISLIQPQFEEEKNEYVANINTNKLHYPECVSAKHMKECNKIYLLCTRDDAILQGYIPCCNCIGK